jgi:ribonuclease PH
VSRPRPHGRKFDELRPVSIEVGVLKFAAGSALLEMGDTRVLVAASLEERVPHFVSGSGKGWVTAEYAMLPAATHTRSQREVTRGRPAGRSSEIQRLIGRSLRGIVDSSALGERTLTIDCDVLQADGGTRTASITAAYVAMVQALSKILLTGDIKRWPLKTSVAAVSVGLLGGEPRLDLEYVEDQGADVDMNVVATGTGQLIEVQGTGEGSTYSHSQLGLMVELGLQGIEKLAAIQAAVLTPIQAEIDAALGKTRTKVPPKAEKAMWGAP